MLYLRSTVFFIGLMLSILIIAPFTLFTAPIPIKKRYKILILWPQFILWMTKNLCKLDYVVEGLENLPKTPCIVFCKHQSAWETLAVQCIFPMQTWIAKRELLWIPLFGWSMKLIDPITINRSSGKSAMAQVIAQGAKKIKEGRWLIIYPEGTRVAPGQRKAFRMGGAVLANHTQVPVIPVAHNAGDYWPRYSFLKYPGTIRFIIGKPIDSQSLSVEALNQQAETWINAKVDEISKTPYSPESTT